MCIAETASASKEVQKLDSTDGTFEDILTAGVRTAQLVAAGARVASDVAGAVLTLYRSGSDDRDDQLGVSNAGTAPGRFGAAAAPALESSEYKCSRDHEFGPPCASCTAVKPEGKAQTPPERKPKRGGPKKETDAA